MQTYNEHNYTVSGKKHSEYYRLSLKERTFNFNNFWYNYFPQNWPSNDRLLFHLTHCLLLHCLGKTKPMTYKLK